MIETAIVNGYCVGYSPMFPGLRSQVALRDVAEALRRRGLLRMSGEELAELETLDEQTAGFFSKIKKGFKKVTKVAKKIAKNKIVKSIYKVAKTVTPPPYSMAFTAAETAVKFGKAVAKGNPKAKAIAPSVREAAEGKISTKELKKRARKLGVNRRVVLKAAAAGKMSLLAKRDPKAAAAMELVKRIETVRKKPEGASKLKTDFGKIAVARKIPGGRVFTVKGPSGRKYRAILAPLN